MRLTTTVLVGLALPFSLPAAADPLCSVDPETLTCAPAPRKDADGILMQGQHVWYEAPTDRYDHGVLGDAMEWGALTYLVQGTAAHGPYVLTTLTLPIGRVFEDIAPRVADLDGDGTPEIIVVETDVDRGASLAIDGLSGDRLVKMAATAFIGQTHRWLAPAGVADFDGDGRVEIAYVDRPHLVQELVFVRLVGDRLIEIARAPGFSNHRIGDPQISGGVQRVCDGPDALLLPDADWRRLRRVTLQGNQIVVTSEGPLERSDDWGRDWANAAGC